MSRRRPRSRVQFQPPFLAGALSLLALGTGCGETVGEGTQSGGTGGASTGPECCTNPPDISHTCPVELPEAGTSCGGYETGLSCGGSTCTPPVICGSDKLWEVGSTGCNPPPPEGGAGGVGGGLPE